MKRIVLSLSIALTLCAGPASARAHGGHWGIGVGFGCWPFWPCWSAGVGLGGACYPAYGYAQPAYSYSSAQPVYAYPPAASAAPTAPGARISAPARPWVPSTPGSGNWVPDPNPYRYVAGNAATPAEATPAATHQTVTITRSPEGVRLYIVR